MTSSPTDQEWHAPRTWPEIPKLWWDYIFDGRLWAVDLSKMPPAPSKHNEHSYFRKYVNGRGQLFFVSTRYNLLGTILYIQSRGRRSDVISGLIRKADRLPLADAFQAPPLPLLPPARQIGWREEVAEDLDFTPEAMALREDFEARQPLDPVPPRALRDHGRLGWIADVCDCGTENFRVHPVTCNAYSMLGYLAHVVLTPKTNPPERWARQFAYPW